MFIYTARILVFIQLQEKAVTVALKLQKVFFIGFIDCVRELGKMQFRRYRY